MMASCAAYAAVSSIRKIAMIEKILQGGQKFKLLLRIADYKYVVHLGFIIYRPNYKPRLRCIPTLEPLLTITFRDHECAADCRK
jgi:hypothetical protein